MVRLSRPHRKLGHSVLADFGGGEYLGALPLVERFDCFTPGTLYRKESIVNGALLLPAITLDAQLARDCVELRRLDYRDGRS